VDAPNGCVPLAISVTLGCLAVPIYYWIIVKVHALFLFTGIHSILQNKILVF